jgi:hypothetical protein
LHWLIHQGHVIEFASGLLETAKKPLPRPPKREPAPKAAETQPAADAAATSAAAAPSESAGQPEVSSATEAIGEPTAPAEISAENVTAEAPAEAQPQQQS